MNFQVKDFEYSTKNIPLASKNTFFQRLIEKTESLIQRMRWKAFFFLNPDTGGTTKETYGFKSKRSPPHVKELKEFEDCMLDMIQKIEFKTSQHPNSLQRKLRQDLKEIREEKHIFVKADKTSNHYKTDPKDYMTLVDKNVTKSYKKANHSVPTATTSKDKQIAEKLGLDDRIELSANRDPFLTMKDHKPDFNNNPTCRLINPSKSEIGIISKHILDGINTKIIQATKVNLWRSTSNAIEWFKTIPEKGKHAFITFDVCDFYPSISEELLMKALDYASRFTNITQQDRQIIIHAKRSLLYHQNSPWKKKNSDNMFDVTMGSYDGAETCELIGTYMLSLIAPKFKDEVGLYRDDGIAVCKATPREIEKIKQEVSNAFKSNGLKITIDANKKAVNFLDVTFDLTTESYKPYMKPNNKLLYVHLQSNHPPALLKNIPQNINKRLTNISSSKEVFDEAIAPYQKAIEESGYDHKLTYNPEEKQTTRNKKNRKRNITWYNPPWDSNVKTNLGKRFLCIVDKCFPKNHPLSKIFNRHTLKLSYSCMPNMKAIIASHNKKVLSNVTTPPTQQSDKPCNCRKKPECPLEEKCLQTNVVYQATVTTETTAESYVGLATNFKERYRNHTTSFRHTNRRNETELSKHVWTLKDAKKSFDIKWKVLRKCQPYNNISKKCNLCLHEKFIIICRKDLCSLNKRNELASSCPHRNRYVLKNFKIT